MTAPHEIRTRIDTAVARYAMLKHPFYQLWSDGQLDREVIGDYAKEYYAHVRAFPTYVSAVHSRCDDLKVRQLLLENLIEEERGGENHPELWLRFAEGLGVIRAEVEKRDLLPSTMDSVERLKSVTASNDFRCGVAALYAYESQIPEVSKAKRAGLQKFYGVNDARTVSFFSIHESADLIHRQTEMKILEDNCESDTALTAIVDAAERAARSLWDFLTGVQVAYVRA